jgi:hypothetical protein
MFQAHPQKDVFPQRSRVSKAWSISGLDVLSGLDILCSSGAGGNLLVLFEKDGAAQKAKRAVENMQ